MAKAFASIDTDGGGTLSLQEVTAAMVKMKMKISPPDLARTFARMDADHSGELDLDEFKHLVKSLEVGPVEPTLRDRRSEAAVRLLQKRHLCSGSGFDLRFDTSTMRDAARRAPRTARAGRSRRRTGAGWGRGHADRALGRASGAAGVAARSQAAQVLRRGRQAEQRRRAPRPDAGLRPRAARQAVTLQASRRTRRRPKRPTRTTTPLPARKATTARSPRCDGTTSSSCGGWRRRARSTSCTTCPASRPRASATCTSGSGCAPEHLSRPRTEGG